MVKKETTSKERLIVLEESVSYIRRDVNHVKQKLDSFIESADKKYATKEELCNIKYRINRDNEVSRSWIQWIPPLIISIILLVLEAIKIYANS